MQGTIRSLFVYPLKSAQGLSLETVEIGATGPLWDRNWMLVNKRGQFVTQRTHPHMTLLKTRMDQQNLYVSFQGEQELSIPKKPDQTSEIEVSLFQKPSVGLHLGSKYDEWFSDTLKDEVRLVSTPEKTKRTTSGRNGPITPLSFPDGYPFLLTNQSTLDLLNSKLETPISMNRFRPNIVVENVTADQEDGWEHIKVGDVEFLAVKACTRCVVITIDPQSGKKNPEVSQVLKSYRTKDKQIIFGQNLTHLNQGKIELGQPITVL